MKGIILAGGSGTRLYPITKGISKQRIPVWDCPMIYYPLATLLRSGVSQLLIISTPSDIHGFQKLLGDGRKLGACIEYAVQEEPKGIAQALYIAESFLDGDSCILILGDNIFHGKYFIQCIKEAILKASNIASIFTINVENPNRFGVIKYDNNGIPIDIEEKPKKFISNDAVTGIYVYPNEAVSIAKKLSPSHRGEFEITDVNRVFLKYSKLEIVKLNHRDHWFDSGTLDSIKEAEKFVSLLEFKDGFKLGCIEQAALEGGLISKEEIMNVMPQDISSSYMNYLKQL